VPSLDFHVALRSPLTSFIRMVNATVSLRFLSMGRLSFRLHRGDWDFSSSLAAGE
jgi:hypothetical protein